MRLQRNMDPGYSLKRKIFAETDYWSLFSERFLKISIYSFAFLLFCGERRRLFRKYSIIEYFIRTLRHNNIFSIQKISRQNFELLCCLMSPCGLINGDFLETKVERLVYHLLALVADSF